MEKEDKRIDAYIEKSAEFAEPILNHLRKIVHKGCPEVEETIKWGMPFFQYKGILCNMAAFKKHCAFGFFKASLMDDPHKILGNSKTGMGHLGKINSLDDLPSDKILIQYIKEAVRLNEKGVKKVSKPKLNKKDLIIPLYLKTAFSKNKKASEVFKNFSYTNKKEYIDWLTEAKTENTRVKRLNTAIKWIAEGKIRNWKYIKK